MEILSENQWKILIESINNYLKDIYEEGDNKDNKMKKRILKNMLSINNLI